MSVKNAAKQQQQQQQHFHVHHNDATEEYSWHAVDDDDEYSYGGTAVNGYYDNGTYDADTGGNYGDENGVARATRTADDFIEIVVRETGCQVRPSCQKSSCHACVENMYLRNIENVYDNNYTLSVNTWANFCRIER